MSTLDHGCGTTPLPIVLRLFTATSEAGDESGGELSPRMTLREFYRRAFVPLWIEGRLDPKTEAAYRESIDWWAQLTGDPPLQQIDDYTAAEFVRRLRQQPGRRLERLSTYTVRRHCRNVGKVLAFAGPKGRDRQNRRNRGVLADPPVIEAPDPDRPAPSGDWTIEELHAVYQACEQMRRPAGLEHATPADWWRALVVVGYYTGLRRGHLLALEWADLMTPWYRGGRITAAANAGKRRRGFRVYLPAEALRHLERIKPQPATGPVFAWPGWPDRPWTVGRQFGRLLRLAGLGDTHDKFHALRKTHLTQLALIDPQQSARLAQQSAGHADQGTTLGHYVASGAIEMVLARAIDALPSPVPGEAKPDNQLRLF